MVEVGGLQETISGRALLTAFLFLKSRSIGIKPIPLGVEQS